MAAESLRNFSMFFSSFTGTTQFWTIMAMSQVMVILKKFLTIKWIQIYFSGSYPIAKTLLVSPTLIYAYPRESLSFYNIQFEILGRLSNSQLKSENSPK